MVSWWFKSLAGKKRIDKFGCVERLAENIDSVHSQEDRPHSHRSVRQIACETLISRSSVHNINKKDLQIGLNFMF